MKTKKITILFFALIALLSSCTKEQLETTIEDKLEVEKEILVFNTFEEYESAVKKSNQMSEVELKKYEESIGFKSFGRMCDEVYFSINPDEFNSIDEVNQWVHSNSEFITLHTDMAGDTYCLPQEFESKERFILNKDRMYIVGDHAYKRVDNALIYADRDNIAKLKAINSLDEVENRVEIKKAPIHNNRQLVDGGSLITKKEQYEDHDDKTVGGRTYRIKLFIQTEIFHYTLPGKVETHRETEYRISNFRRSVGIWFSHRIRTDYEILLRSIDDKSLVERQVTTKGLNKNVNEAVIRDDDKYKVSDGLTWDYKPYFYYYYAYAKNEYGCERVFPK